MPSQASNPASGRLSPSGLDDPHYYLHNFRYVLEWVLSRYGDLLNTAERQFVADFQALPVTSQGLLVRMVMRKGQIFRADKLRYEELGATERAVVPLVERGWVTASPALDVPSLFKLFTWPELRQMLAAQLLEAGVATVRKGAALAALVERGLAQATPAEWGAPEVQVYEFNLMPVCDRFRLMFFGNAHQDWSEFVLTELGTFRYEPVAFSDACRPFHSRAEIDAYLQLQACRERFFAEEPLEEVAADLPALPSNNPWLVAGRDRLVFKVAREWERVGELGQAAQLYLECTHPEARGRLLRVLERSGGYELALALAQQIENAPTSEAERQQVQRVLPRLQRKLGLPCQKKKPAMGAFEQFELRLPFSVSVEDAVKHHLGTDTAPTYYVENTLITGLFGLLCWDAIFAPLPGAFFHPFQPGPADLHWPDFHRRRESLFDACFQQLESENYRVRILANFTEKWGVQSPFVHWGSLSKDLLENALACVPADHLKCIFQRLLRDVKANRTGLPDLIQFLPHKRQYRMIEVKGPGDKLQDNQQRWLDFFARHDMPAAVCHVRWTQEQTPVE